MDEGDESCITIRQACKQDRNPILEIHDNVFDGTDYMPAYVDKFLTCAHTRSYVACYRVVGFCAEYIVDDGLTGVMRGARVHPKFQGKGVYKLLTEYIRARSTAKISAFTVSDLNPCLDRPSFREQNRFILEQAIHSYMIDEEFWKYKREKMNVSQHVNEINHETIKQYLNYPAFKSYLFPQNRIVIYGVPYKATEANVPLLNWDESEYYTSVAETNKGQASGLLSISTNYKTRDPPYFFSIDVYGTNVDNLVDHIHAHLCKITRKWPFPIGLSIYTDMSVNPEFVDAIFAQYCIARCPRTREWMARSKSILFEKEVASHP